MRLSETVTRPSLNSTKACNLPIQGCVLWLIVLRTQSYIHMSVYVHAYLYIYMDVAGGTDLLLS